MSGEHTSKKVLYNIFCKIIQILYFPNVVRMRILLMGKGGGFMKSMAIRMFSKFEKY